MTPSEKRQALLNDPLVGSVHDALLDANKTVVEAFEDATLWLCEYMRQVKYLESKISAGYVRRDTTALSPLHPKIRIEPVVDDGAWLATGAEDD
jgi:hypothetical protein